MYKLILFVEGENDVYFVNNVLSNVFRQHRIILIPITYQQKKNHNVKKDILSANSKKGLDYFLLTDLDSHTYPCITSRKQKRKEELNGTIDLDKIIVVREEIESWVLAGIDNSLDEFKDLVIPNDTEEVTKEDFLDMLEKSDLEMKTLYTTIGLTYNWNLALKRNKSLKYFMNKAKILN